MAVEISESSWKAFTKKLKLEVPLEDKDLLKALAGFAKTDEHKPELRLEALKDLAKEIPRQVTALAKQKKTLGDKPFGLLRDELYAMLEETEALRKKAQATLDAEDDEDEDSVPSALVNPKLLLKQLAMCRKDPERTVKFAFVDAKGKDQPPVLAMHPRMSARALFGKLQAAAGVKTGAYGSAWVDGMSLMLQLDKPLSGLVKKVRPPVRACGFRIAKAVLWNPDGSVFEQDELPEEAVGDGHAEPTTPATPSGPAQGKPSAPPQPAATYEAKLAALLPRVRKAADGSSPDATKHQRLLAFAAGKAEGKDFLGAVAALKQVEQLLDNPAPRSAKDGSVDAGVAFKARLTALLPKMKEAQAAGHPVAQDARLKASEAGVFAGKGDFGSAQTLLDEAEELLRAAAAAEAAALKEKQLAAELEALAQRLKPLQEELARLKAYDTPIGAELRKRVAAIEAALEARTSQGLAKLLDELAKLTEAVAAKRQVGAAAAVKGAEVTQEKALQQREKELGVEVDAALTELRRVTQSIKDDTLRQPVAQALDALSAGKIAALEQPTPAARIDALQTVLDGGPAVRKLADEALLEEAAKLAYETAYTPLKPALGAATSALATAPDAFTDAQRAALEDGEKTRAGAVAARRWGDAEAALVALAQAAADVDAANAAHAAYLSAYAGIQADFEAAEKIVAGSPSDDIEGDVDYFEGAREPLDDAVAAKDWVAAEAAVAEAGEAAEHLIVVAEQYQDYRAAYGLIHDDFTAARDLLKAEPDTFAPKLAQDFAAADKAVDDQIARPAWGMAAGAMPALGAAAKAVVKARADHHDFMTAAQSMAGDIQALAAIELAPVPETESKAVEKAFKALEEAGEKRDWVAARASLTPLRAAMKAVQAVLLAGTKYYTAFNAITDVYRQARKVDSDEDRLALPNKAFSDAVGRMTKSAKAREWDKATARVAEVQAAALALVAANEAFHLDSQPFEDEYAKLTDLAAARKVSAQAPASFKPAALATFRTAYLKVNDARNAGDFKTAADGLDALGKAITALLKAKADDDQAKAEFELALAAVKNVAQARALAVSKDAALATAAKQLTDADAAVAQAAAQGNWAGALAAVPALDAAVKGLTGAQAGANKAVMPEQADDLAKRILALKPRTDKATQGPTTPHLARLKQAVVDRLAATNKAVVAKDYVAAEIGLTELVVDLDAMDTGQKEFDDHLGRYRTAKTVDIKNALAVKLNSAPLTELRAQALDKLEKLIQAHGNKGKLAKADALLVEWVNEAKAWNKAKAVYLNLKSSGGPDRAKLEALANELGGGKVLDALIAQLPDTTPQKFITEALSVRYGFSVQQFEKKNPKRLSDLTGLTAVDVNLPDKSLKDMYAVLGKVPLANVKGKIDQLIRFTEEKGGAAYGGRKVYMYCGRTDDPKASQQKFGQTGEVVPDGEEVDDACKPVDDKPVPYFNFAAVHEVGHAVDHAKGYMASAQFKAYAGWEKHGSSDAVAAKVAAHFDYDLDYVKATLADKKSKAPPAPATRSDRTDAEWEAARKKVDAWCQSVRVGNALWNQAGLSKQHAIDGRVYHEAYDGDWVSYLFSARAQGITGYQFRAPGEWFAELYAAYFSKKLKKSHPASAWLQSLKTIT